MNKVLKTVLIFSIAVNAIALVGAAAGWFSIGKHKPSRNVARGDAHGGAATAAREVASLLSTGDAVTLRDGLRALGLPDDFLRAIVEARINRSYTARREAIYKAMRDAAAQRPYWRGTWSTAATRSETIGQIKELNSLWGDQRKQVIQVLGADNGIPSWAQLTYPFLSSDKAEQLSQLQSDYVVLQQQAMQDMSGFRMPDDDAAFKLITAERQRDIAALLTPDEKKAYDLRNSTTAYAVQRAFAGFNGTQEEYDAVFALQNAHDEKFPNNTAAAWSGADTTDTARARNDDQKQVDAQIKDALGDDRYADYVRAQRLDYQSLQAAAQRFNLGPDTVAQAYQARDDIAGAAKQISDDTSMNPAQKQEAYTALADQAATQIKAALGDDIGDAYIANALPWVKNMTKGGYINIDERGHVTWTQRPKAPGKMRRQ